MEYDISKTDKSKIFKRCRSDIANSLSMEHIEEQSNLSSIEHNEGITKLSSIDMIKHTNFMQYEGRESSDKIQTIMQNLTSTQVGPHDQIRKRPTMHSCDSNIHVQVNKTKKSKLLDKIDILWFISHFVSMEGSDVKKIEQEEQEKILAEKPVVIQSQSNTERGADDQQLTRNMLHACDICANLRKHMRLHTDKTSLRSDLFDKGYSDLGNSHLRPLRPKK
ncbi:unnamed protein product [Mytilus coruscus]|uniref:Uncharacterized protein n=1 Tax=Mytilus coruscus TaxID=42192 RepID=A0A6J8E693_MYTCO|nr:unnamed protein product [Mytilus coruscus]